MIELSNFHRIQIDVFFNDLCVFMKFLALSICHSGSMNLNHTFAFPCCRIIRHKADAKRNFLFRQLSHLFYDCIYAHNTKLHRYNACKKDTTSVKESIPLIPFWNALQNGRFFSKTADVYPKTADIYTVLGYCLS